MKKELYAIFILFSIIGSGCTNNSGTNKYQSTRNHINKIQDKIKEIEIEDVLIGSVARLFLIDDYLIIVDYKSGDNQIHIFNQKDYSYITSTATRGQGPGEIANIGYIGINEEARTFYVSDHGKLSIYSYNLDSVLIDPFYMPEEKLKINNSQFPDRYLYINDTLSIGIIIEPIGNSDYNSTVGKWNMNTGEIKPMPYKHPKINKKRISFTASIEDNIYIECYSNYDLMTICSINGDLKYNIHGPNWKNKSSERKNYYEKVLICKDYILASYSGGDYNSKDHAPTKLHVFNINGDYIKTLETGYRLSDYCYDEKNNLLIMNLDDEIQFAYLDLDGII